MPILRALLPILALVGCNASGQGNQPAAPRESSTRPFRVETIGQFSQPWAMTFLPGGRQALITERRGTLKLWTVNGGSVDVAGVPAVDYGGQGGLGDVILHPGFAHNRIVYLSWVEAGPRDTRGAAVGRARLETVDGRPRLEGLEVIWRQQPKLDGRGHFGHRLAFSPDGRYLFISSGERQHFDPAQDMRGNLGKVLRINPDGSIPDDNPFYNPLADSTVDGAIWTLGHRNPLGLAFAPDGRLWEVEMGPQGGDEMNLIERGRNYGYPIVSNGDHYDGRPIPDHPTHPEFAAPKAWWTPVISPGDMIIYSGSMFPRWRGDALIAGLSSEALIHVDIDGSNAREVERWRMEHRMREIEQAPDGSIYMLEDENEEGGGRLLRLVPAR